jgi:hypothetical protein
MENLVPTGVRTADRPDGSELSRPPGVMCKGTKKFVREVGDIC